MTKSIVQLESPFLNDKLNIICFYYYSLSSYIEGSLVTHALMYNAQNFGANINISLAIGLAVLLPYVRVPASCASRCPPRHRWRHLEFQLTNRSRDIILSK